MGVLSILAICHLDASRHAEMRHPNEVGIEIKQEELAVTTQVHDNATPEAVDEIRRPGLAADDAGDGAPALR